MTATQEERQQLLQESQQALFAFLYENGFSDTSCERRVAPPQVPNFERDENRRETQIYNDKLFRRNNGLPCYDFPQNVVWTAENMKTGRPIRVRTKPDILCSPDELLVPLAKDVLSGLIEE